MTTTTTDDDTVSDDFCADDLLTNPPTACQPLASGLRIPITLLTPSPLNPRKRWKPARVAEMAESLRTNAQIQPIRVRPNPLHTPSNGRPPYEIVVGETRWRAAPAAGLHMLDAVVGDYTDQQVIELALAENTKRQDLHPLEEADGYDQLLRKADGLQGYATVQDLAAHVGASPSYVYQRLKLRALCAAARAAFLDGTIDASVALLIARMPDQAEQATATAKILQGFGGEPYSFRAAAEYLKRDFMLALGRAKFDIAATYTVAGPCAGCTKRSGAAPDLFADVTGGDMCQDARCYQAKVAEAYGQLLATARAEGHQVLQGDAARKVMTRPDANPIGHHRLNAPCPSLTESRKPLADLLPRTAKRVLLEHPQATGTLVELATDAVVKKALKAKGLLREDVHGEGSLTKKAAPTTSSTPPTGQGQIPAAFAAAGHSPARGGEGAGDEAKRRQTEDQRLREEASLTCEKFGFILAAELHDQLSATAELPLLVLRLALLTLFQNLSADACNLVYETMGWRRRADGSAFGQETFDSDFIKRMANDQLGGRQLGELLALVLVAEDLTNVHIDPGTLRDDKSNAATLADSLAVDMQRTWRHAGIAARTQLAGEGSGNAPGAARREPDATTTFLQQHAPERGRVDPTWAFPGTKPTTTEAGNGQADQSDKGASNASA